MFNDWLDEATANDLDGLADAVLDGRISAAPSSGSIQLAGFGGGAVALLAHLQGTDPRVVAWMLRRLAHEKRQADDRFAAVAQLVWSGASEDDGGIRDTRVVLDDLFAHAEREVLLATFVIYDGATVFRPLVERFRKVRSLKIEFFVNLPSKTGAPEDEGPEVASFLDRFHRYHWPADLTVPAIYYDPEGRRQGLERASQHAKCVVIDQRWSFIGSANFTGAAQGERNIETGVLLDHRPIAEALVRRFTALRETGRLVRMNP
jgi:phosphatidylserine/phosphatidylglycerophosphate/cardiolipin synthase-like enzyme